MADIVWDFSDKVTTTATTFPSSPNYEYVRKDGYYTILEEISIAGDASFLSVGDIDVRIKGQSVCTSAGVPVGSGISLLTNYTAQFKRDNVLAVLAPGESVQVYVKSDGTSINMAVAITGYRLHKEELEKIVRAREAAGAVII